ncbi:MAG: nucleotidyltransferase family protein [Planctomycetota bacterium]|nr:nucleotidyltransferase family protein [Planctomycetota bacterium]
MRRADALRTLGLHAAELHERFEVERLSIFGSVARDEARDSSDVDLLVNFARPVTLFTFIRLRAQLAAWLEAPVDLAEEEALHARHRDRILREAIRAA